MARSIALPDRHARFVAPTAFATIAQMQSQPDWGKRGVWAAYIIGIPTVLLGVFAYFRPPDPTHPIPFDFLFRTVSIPVWLIISLLVLAVGLALAFRVLSPRLTKTVSQKLQATEIRSSRSVHPQSPSKSVAAEMLTAKVQSEPVTPKLAMTPAAAGSLVFESPDLIAARVATFESSGVRGVQLQVENYRLTAIHQVRVVLAAASSFDARHQAYREPTVSGQAFNRPDAIRASGSGRPITLLWKESRWNSIVTGESNIVHPLGWPENDKSDVERWKISLRVLAFEQKKNAHGNFLPLRELPIDIIVTWDRERNTFALEEVPVMPPEVPGHPENGEDGTSRNIVRYIMRGPDRLLAYTTTRQNLPGSRFLVIRARPDLEPQTLETADRAVANAQWGEWYLEWKRDGFGGASGNGLDGAPPFE